MLLRKRKIGALIIGQTPRPDLVDPLIGALPSNCDVIQTGALDELEVDSIPSQQTGPYVLTTRLRNGAVVKVEESYLGTRLQDALDGLEAQGVVATVLLCAGTFDTLGGTRPLFKPFMLARNILGILGMRSIGLIVPIPEQEEPVRRRWSAAGFDAHVWTADLGRQDDQFRKLLSHQTSQAALDCLVLDYVGHPLKQVSELRRSTDLPLIDLGQLAISICASSL